MSHIIISFIILVLQLPFFFDIKPVKHVGIQLFVAK